MPDRAGRRAVHSGRVVTWDMADTTTLCCATVGAEVGPGEISLLFASRVTRRGGREETVAISDRIILNPFTAMRMHEVLQRVMARHLALYGEEHDSLRAFRDDPSPGTR
jgi:hypothetical protein